MRHRIAPSFFTVNAVQSARLAVLAALLLSLLGSTGVIRGQVPYNSLEDVYTQNFDSLPATGTTFTWVDNSTLLGWYAANSGSTPFNPAGVSTGSTTNGNLYSFGSTSASDRSIGSIGSGSTNAGTFYWGVKLVNNTGVTITSVTVSYTGEQWRNSAAAAQAVSFQYSLSATNLKTGSYTSVTLLDFVSPITGGTSGALNGNTSTARRVIGPVTITNINWLPNTVLWLRWVDPDHAGYDHGLAIDDFTFRTGTPASPYEPPIGYYDSAQGLKGRDLEIALHNIISPHTIIPDASSSTDTWDALNILDEDPIDPTKVRLIYSHASALKAEAGVTWYREHLWSPSRGIDDSGADATDLFNLRPANSSVTSARGNKLFDNSDPLDPNYQSPAHANAAPDTSCDTDSWQPPEDERGAIARAVFYMHVRYDGNTAVDPNTTDLMLQNFITDTSDMAVLNTLLDWHRAYPVSEQEKKRNYLIYTQFQHNRNPFVDNPDFADSLFTELLRSADDEDMDGMPSSWEEDKQFDPTNPADAALDADNDGFSNFEEYWMGSDPHDPASPIVIHVNGSSPNSFEDGSPPNPYKRIQSAIDTVPNSELRAIVVEPGTYNERPYATGKSRIHLFSHSGATQTVIEGGVVDSSVVRLYNFDRATISGFTIQNAQTSWTGAGLRIDSPGGMVLVDSNIIKNNVTTANSASGGGGGMYIKAARGSRVINNFITSNSAIRGGGVLFAAGDVEFWHNTVVSNQATGGQGGGLSALLGVKPDVRNNIIWSNTGTGGNDQIHQLTASNNVMQNAAGSGNIALDPLFIAPAAGNYHIAFGSPARNAAVPVPIAVDFDYNPRPELRGTNNDIGADETVDTDSDGDGLLDWDEINVYHTDPNNSDTDGDGITDGWEIRYGLNPLVDDAGADPDADELSNLDEFDLGTDPHVSNTNVGVSQGKISAEPSGGSSYTLPIVVSPGTAGIQPKLAFQYSSGSRNGAMGIGWSISGISAISRAPQTLVQDGAIHGVDMSLNDRYALDGQRLIVINGTDGGQGAEYRTELNSFVKVVSNGSSGGGPATFTAWTKSGLIYTFGGADGASFVPAGRTDGTILTWFISKVQDQAGNYMTFQYSAEGNILSINYTKNDNAGLGTYASIVFTYDATRPDPAFGYVAGSAVQSNQRLSKVTSFYGAQIVRCYFLKYESSATTGKSRLIGIKEASSSGAFPATRFAWNETSTSLEFTPKLAAGEEYNGGHWIQGDFNGDGIADVARAGGTIVQIYRIESGELVEAGSITTAEPDPDDTWLQGDFSGDGKLDLARVKGVNDQPTDIVLFTNTGNNESGTTFSKTAASIEGASIHFFPTRIFMAMDANADGKLDIVCINGLNYDDLQSGGNGAQDLRIKVYLNDPTGNQPGTFVVQQWDYTSDGSGTDVADKCKKYDQWFVGDFNGDGLPDLAKIFPEGNQHKCSVRVYLNQNGSYLAANWVGQNKKFFLSDTDEPKPAYIWAAGDFNGDGLMDIARVPKEENQDGSTTVEAFLSTGSASTKFTAQNWFNGILTVNNRTAVQAGDYNADGRSDLAVLEDHPAASDGHYKCTRSMFISNGLSFYLQTVRDEAETIVSSTFPPQLKKWLTADFNGDGKEDLIRVFKNSNDKTFLNIWTSEIGYHDLLSKITDGMGSEASIDYQPLTGVDGVNVFTPSTDAVSPAIDLTVPMPVVASITYDNGLGAAGSDGSKYSVSYRYEGLKADPKRGMLGFRSVEAIDNRPVDNPNPSASPSDTPDASKALHTKSWFKQGFPYTGLVERAITYLGAPTATKSFSDSGGLLSLTTTLHQTGPTESPRIYFPYTQNSHVYSWDLNGVATNDTESIVQRDDAHAALDVYGNAWGSVVKTKDLPSANLFIKTTSSDYTASTSNWRISQMTGSSVVHESPGQLTITRSSGFSYDTGNGQVGSEIVEPGAPSYVQTVYEYDTYGNTKKSTTSGSDIDPRETTTNYDIRGRFLATTINALGHSETKEYDERFGAVTAVVGPNALRDTAQYDGFSRKILSERADHTKTVTTYEWSSGPNAPANAVYLVRVKPDDGPEAITYFDRLGRELRRQSVAGNGQTLFVDMSYDYRGRKKTVTKPYFAGAAAVVATTLYDAIDRVRQLQVPSVDENGTNVLTYTTTDYDELVTTVTNPKSQQTTTTKDAAGHVVRIKDALNGTITYTYDSVGQLIQTADSATPSNITTVHYDVRGRKDWVDDPDLGRWSYGYFATGELKWQEDAKNQRVNFQYDKLGRIKQRDDPTGDHTVWTYDSANGKGIGKLAKVEFTPSTGSQLAPYSNTITYDTDFGRVKTQSTLIAGSTYVSEASYDQHSRVTGLVYPTGFSVKQVYDPNGYLSKIQKADGSLTYWEARGYDADGHITEDKSGNGIVTDRVYVPENGLIKEIRSGSGLSTSVQNLEYRFDILGNLKKRTDRNQTIGGNVLTESFDYDDLNRVRHAQVTGQAPKTFDYDILGNIIHKDDVGEYSYLPASGSLGEGERSHPHAVRSINGGANATYDRNGNMTGGFSGTITWTWFNMPQSIQRYGASRDFTYDPDHNRITQRDSSGGELMVTTYVGGFFEKVDDGNTIKYKHYISSPMGRVAIYTKSIDEHTFAETTDTKYLHKDHLGSIDVVTNETGTVLERESFDTWGFRRTTDWQAQQPSSYRSIVSRGYTDHDQMDDLGLINMNGRVYDPGIGRFLSADPFVQAPMVTQNFNRYSYVLNNPLSFTDPSGFNFLNDFGDWLKDVFGSTGAQVVIGVISVVVAIVAWYAAPVAFTAITGISTTLASGALSTTGLIVAGVGAGFSSGFLSTSLSGASLGQALEAGLISGAIGGITAGAGGTLFRPAAGEPFGEIVGKSVGRALLGGALTSGASAIEGASPRDGFVGAFVSELIAPSMNGLGGQGIETVALRVAASAVAGGTAAELTGGKFANGAITAAFVRLVYEEVRIGSQAGTKNMGSATSSGFNALSVVGNLIGKIWALPNTLIGLAYGAIGWALGGDAPIFGYNAIEFTNSPIMKSAMTFGNVQVFGRGVDPTAPDYPFEYHTVGDEEMHHTIQAQVLGPLYFPAHIIGGIISMFSAPNPIFSSVPVDSWHRNNFMELGPMQGRTW